MHCPCKNIVHAKGMVCGCYCHMPVGALEDAIEDLGDALDEKLGKKKLTPFIINWDEVEKQAN